MAIEETSGEQKHPKKAGKCRSYSRRGDLGETSLRFGPRVGKDHLRVRVCGTLDELNSFLGLARTEELLPEVDAVLLKIQTELFRVSEEVMSFSPTKFHLETIQPQDIQYLETLIEQFDSFEMPSHFLIPGGSKGAALLHVARTVCRRAERLTVALVRKDETVSRHLMAWLNRLSSLFFVLSQVENAAKQVSEQVYTPTAIQKPQG